MTLQSRIKTPHAAVIVWNYADRIGTEGMTSAPDSSGVSDLNGVEQIIISTLSCISIQTSKSKGQPVGQFQLVLSPFKNWVSTITAGSWCCIMMSNEPITEADLRKANKNHVKMIGKIESVRVETQQVDDQRQTRFYVSGVDWGHVFNNVVYVDNLIASINDPKNQGNAAAVALRNMLFGKDGAPKSFHVDHNLRSIINIFGKTLKGFTDAGKDINRLAGALYNFKIPKQMIEFFDFRSPSGKSANGEENLNKILSLKTGTLISKDTYRASNEARGFINPFSLQGQHTFWQILLENSNPVLNEMFPEMRWNDKDNGLHLTVYNRIKPFAYKDFKPSAGATSSNLKSYFQYIKQHSLDDATVISVNAGTNWRDKYNFIEIKPEFQDMAVFSNWFKQKSQTHDPKAFEREGFRPLILETRQFPADGSKEGEDSRVFVDWAQLSIWVAAMREWYFNTHRMLNGTITLQGITGYISVGDNIRFSSGLINPTPNINKAIADKQAHQYVLAHVESISHSFSVNGDARNYITTIQFVRGILVDGDNVVAGLGTLDKLASLVPVTADRNKLNTVSTSVQSDPDPDKIRGT